MAPLSGQDEALHRMSKLVNFLMSKPDSEPFREPVDWRGLELFDYPKVIQKMMDLGTIKRKLERQQYPTAHACAQDIRLVWSNCMAYNADGSDFWLLAKSFSRRFEDRYRKIRSELDVGENLDDGTLSSSDRGSSSGANKGAASGGNKAAETTSLASSSAAAASVGMPSLDARAKFASNLFLLSGVELAHVITTLELECPHVLEEEEVRGDDNIEINVDAIPGRIFAELNRYVTEIVGVSHHNIPEVDDITSQRSHKKRKK